MMARVLIVRRAISVTGHRVKRAYGDRPQREPRGEDKAPREFVRRSARDDARAERHIQRDRENANLAADPVYSALTSSAPPAPKAPKGPPPAHPSGQNRRERRDAARAEGKIAAIGVETPKRTWTPEGEARPVRTERPATERRERTEHRKPEGFKPRGPKAPGGKPFKARGDKPSFGGKSFGGKPGGKPFRGKPAGKRDGRS
jgi:23S rRNA pseudouridine2605 synthase